MESRIAKVSFNKSGGTAKGKAITNRITIPTKWIKEMDITEEDRNVELKFEDGKIIIKKVVMEMNITNKEIRESAKVVSYRYNQDLPTTAIILDENKILVMDYIKHEEYLYNNNTSKLIGVVENYEFEGKKNMTIKDAEEKINKMIID
ncbi:hypothetical protein D4A35_18045 (plasmid) [Paraclostridium bifermentans]|uniref:AbrB/MazE/SpoVT family DNA-binding domain-containing protein n=1 Tax=Paraclostridium bifermentans TaxID=1490 RepID=A0A5P3XKE6_PARBF|nr:hypothetical protein [Paraclostridium bifermentans]QEZ70837.1 hypothetical protein D4A35_18045 [Paraclostridium bifermentans]